MIYVNFQTNSGSPNSVAWHEWRAGGLGASDSMPIAEHAGLIEVPDWCRNINSLFYAKIGYKECEVVMNAAMRIGTEMEAKIRSNFEDQTGVQVMPLFGEAEFDRRIRASFDGISFDDEIVEIKIGESAYAIAKEGRIPEYYLPQLAHQMAVFFGHPKNWTGKEKGWFVAGHPLTAEIVVIPYTGSDLKEMAIKLVAAEQDFLDCLEKKIPPVGGAEFDALVKEMLPIIKERQSQESVMELAEMYAIAAHNDGVDLPGVEITYKISNTTETDWPAILESLGATEDSLDPFRGKPVLTFRTSGKVSCSNVNVNRHNAHEAYMTANKKLTEINEVLKPFTDQGKEILKNTGGSRLVGPSMSFSQRRGNPSYKKWMKANNVSQEFVDKFKIGESNEIQQVNFKELAST